MNIYCTYFVFVKVKFMVNKPCDFYFKYAICLTCNVVEPKMYSMTWQFYKEGKAFLRINFAK